MATTVTVPITSKALYYNQNNLQSSADINSDNYFIIESKNCQYLSIEIPKSSVPPRNNKITFDIYIECYYDVGYTLDLIYFITDSSIVPKEDLLEFSSTRRTPKSYWHENVYKNYERYSSSGKEPLVASINLSDELLSLEKAYLHITTREYPGYDNGHICNEMNFNSHVSDYHNFISYLSYEVSFDGNIQDGGNILELPKSLQTDNKGSVVLPDLTHEDTTVVKNIIVKGKGNGGIDISSEGSTTTKSSYELLGWKYGETLYTSGERFYPEGDCTLVASWKRNILDVVKDLPQIGKTTREDTREHLKLYLDANGGTCDTKVITSEYTKSYELKEWNTVAAGIGFSYSVGSTFEDSITLYAIWDITSKDYSNIELPTSSKLDTGLYECDYLGWSLDRNSLTAEYYGVLDVQTVSTIEDLSTLYAVYNIPEINYSLYLGAQRIKSLYLGTEEVKFCIHEEDRLSTLGYSPEYYYIILRESPLSDTNVDLLTLTPEVKNTSWVISSDEPENPEEGMVWIQIIPSENSTFTINDIPLYLVRCLQYISGKWIYNDTTKVRRDGVWTDFGYSYDYYLIPRGNSIEDSNFDLLYMDITKDNEITPWIISEIKPKTPEEGTIWIQSILLNSGGIQIGDKHLYLLRGMQYISGEWVYNDTTRIRESGVWEDFGYDEYHLVIPKAEDYSGVNVIKVDTNVKPTSYSISSEEPTTPEDGMVWIVPNPYNSPINPVIVQGNTSTYPKICNQYTSDSWVGIPASTLEDGSYIEWWDGYIFKSGVLNSSFTLRNNSNIKISDVIDIPRSETAPAVRGSISTIDCSLYSKIHVKGALTGLYNMYSYFRVGLCPTTYDPYSAGFLNEEEFLDTKEFSYTESQEDTTLTFDVSDFNEECSLIFYGSFFGGHISEILCE